MTETQRHTVRLYILAALGIGIGFWVFDALLDYLVFYAGRGSFLDMLVLRAPGQEIFHRITFLTGMLIGGLAGAAIVTRKRRVERTLEIAIRRLSTALEASPDAIALTRLSDGHILKTNQAFLDMFGLDSEQIKGRTSLELGIWPDPADRVALAREVAETGHSAIPEAVIRRADGTPLHVSLTAMALASEDEPHLLSIVRDVTDLVTARREVERSRQHLYDVLEGTTDAYFELDADFTITFVNSKAAQSMGRPREELVGRVLWDVFPGAGYDPCRAELQRALRQQAPVEFESRTESPDGSRETWSEVHAYPTPHSLSVYYRDISARKEEARRLHEALRQNEIMLKEIHHRVKNNMQIVSSLLSLQSGIGGDPAEAFRETQGRIRAMALVHEELYRSSDMAGIDFDDYVTRLAERLHDACAPGKQIAFDVDLGRLTLPLDKAVPMGLALNELLTNALRHAFPNGSSGTVGMRAHRRDGQVVITVADDGVGMPEGFAPVSGGGLGSQIIDALVGQVGGRLDYGPAEGGGTLVTITLPEAGGTP